MGAAKAALKPVEGEPRTANFELPEALYGGLESGDYPKLTLIVGGSVRQYEPSKNFDGDLPEPGSKVRVEFEGYRVNVTAVAKSGTNYQRSIETLRVLSMRAAG